MSKRARSNYASRLLVPRSNERLAGGHVVETDAVGESRTRTITRLDWGSAEREETQTSDRSTTLTGTSPQRRSQTTSANLHHRFPRRSSTALVETVLDDEAYRRCSSDSTASAARVGPSGGTRPTFSMAVASSQSGKSQRRTTGEDVKLPEDRPGIALHIHRESGVGSKRRRRPEPQGSSPTSPPTRRLRGDERKGAPPPIPALSTPNMGSRECAGHAMPTPLPRRFTILTSTPAFLRNAQSPPEESDAPKGQTPARSTFARGFSHLRESLSYALSVTPAAPSQVIRASAPLASPWALSSIPEEREATLRSIGSSLGNYLHSEAREDVTGQRRDDITSPSPSRGSQHRKNDRRLSRGVDGDDDVLGFLGKASADPRHATLSSLSESLPGIMNTSQLSIRTSLSAPGHSSVASTALQEPDVSPILRVRNLPRVRCQDKQQRETGNGGVTKESDRHAHINGHHYIHVPVMPPSLDGDTRRFSPVPGTAPDCRIFGYKPDYECIISWQRSIGYGTRVCVRILFIVLCACLQMSLAAPLLRSDCNTDEGITRYYVNTVPELHALYQIPPASLLQPELHRLSVRILGESVERLERGTQHRLRPSWSPGDPLYTHQQRIIYLRQAVHAYKVAQRRMLVYVRSRDASRWRRWVQYPLSDLWRFVIQRQGVAPGLSVLLSGLDLWDRLTTAVGCLSGHEALACPSCYYTEQSMVAVARTYVGYEDVNAAYESPERRRSNERLAHRLQRNWDSEVYMETLLSYIRSETRKLTRA